MSGRSRRKSCCQLHNRSEVSQFVTRVPGRSLLVLQTVMTLDFVDYIGFINLTKCM